MATDQDLFSRKVTAKKDGGETIRYTKNNKFVKAAEVPEEVQESLSVLSEGAVVDQTGAEVEVEQVDEAAEAAAKAVADAQPSTPKELDKAAAKGAAPDVEPDEVPVTTREDETPGGPQEPVVAAPLIPIDTADDVDDESGVDVEEQARANRAAFAQDQDGEGMGFPRKNGKTVDVFDGKTPHTHVRFVANIMVPVSEENFNNRTDGEIIEKLRELGKIA